MRVFLIGFMGSGKSHWGKQLAAQLQMPYIDLDAKIIDTEKRSIAKIFEDAGEEYFRMIEKETLYTLVDENESLVISCGGGTPCFFNNIGYMKKHGIVVWLNTHVDVLLQRLLHEKSQRPLIRDIPDDGLKTYIVRKLNERRMYYDQANVVIDNENSISPAIFIQTILHA